MSTMAAALGAFITNVATTYAKAVDRKLSTVSLSAADDPNILPRIAAGGGKANFTIERFDRIVLWFVEHWPPEARWPKPPAWPFTIPTPVITGEYNGKAKEGRRDSNVFGKAEARKAAKGGRSTKSRARRKEAQHGGGERSAD
jgi:hypothetical protein